jgi:hypothetical protein
MNSIERKPDSERTSRLMAILIVVLGVLQVASSVVAAPSRQVSYASRPDEEPPALTRAYSSRNLSEYASLGTIKFEFDGTINDKEKLARDRARADKMREDLWDHWRRRQRLHVRLVHDVPRRARVEKHVFIEPDRGGRWRLITISCYSGDGSPARAITYVAHRVVRVDASTWKPLLASHRTRPGNFRLANLNEKGELVSLDL